MLFVLAKAAEFLLAPAHMALLAATAGVALQLTRFWRLGNWLTLLGVLALLAMSFVPLGALLALPLENRFAPPPAGLAAPTGVIVLGGSIDERVSAGRGRPAISAGAERLIAALELARRFPKAKLVFTGGATNGAVPEAEFVKRLWREAGLDRGNVVYETRARTTWENAVFTRDLLTPDSSERWLLVTSAMHMPRAMGAFRKAGFSVIAYPVDYRTSGRWPEWDARKKAPDMMKLVHLATHEWIGLLVYRLSGKTDALVPAP